MTLRESFAEKKSLSWKLIRWTAPSLFVVAGLMGQYSFRSLIGGKVFLLLFPPLLIGSILCGFGPGLIATALAVIGAWYFFVPEVYSFHFQNPTDAFGVGVFFLTGVLATLIGAKVRSSRLKEQQALQLTNLAEQRFRSLIESAPDSIIITDKDGKITLINHQTELLLGYSREELIGESVDLMVASAQRPQHAERRREYAKQPSTRPMGRGQNLFAVAKDGKEIPVEISLSPSIMGPGLEVVAVLRDITARRKAEEDLLASLKEKDVLLREIHHRVKNNLNIVSSLLELQAKGIEHPGPRSALIESQNRVISMALIHEKLYQSKNIARIDFGNYIEDLVLNIYHSYGSDRERIQPQINIDAVNLDIDTAIPCSLIINELVSNSLKYAFPAQKQGHLTIALKRDDKIANGLELTVRDDGIGFPKDFPWEASTSLGLKLVMALTKQIGGKFEREETKGTGFKISFVCAKKESLQPEVQ